MLNGLSLSIVIPVWNEQDNIKLLVESINKTLSSHQITYELIFVDDHSDDETRTIIKSLAKDYPIQYLLKEGERGKAQSLIQGFKYCRYPFIAMIDADLQYSPEYMPIMMQKMVEEKLDLVLAQRIDHETGFIRKLASKVFVNVFVKWLHGFDLDSQSGLKIFKQDILNYVQLDSKGWSFDLDFLLQIRAAGFKIGSEPITFHARHSGEAKVKLLSASYQMAKDAIRLKFRKMNIVSFKGGIRYKGAEFVHHSELHHSEIALQRFGGNQIKYLMLFAAVFALLLFFDWHATLLITFGLLTILYFLDLLFNLFLIYRSLTRSPEYTFSDEEIDKVKKWPKYTVFCPLYKEWQVIPQFVTAMSKLDYPKDKLQIMLLLEENDEETVLKTVQYDLPSNFDVVIVPHSMPKTKPKALNYGLSKAKGEYIVIYDAEDVPDPKQLKKAVLAFRRADEKTICVQAKLNFYNPHQNILTKVFTAEYSLWFDLILPGLQSIGAPIPLGGTSNHFRKSDVKFLKGWDAFNVTEDCDLGIRLAKQGYKTAMVESTTLEEANSRFGNWFSQRSRWIKGYIQTYLVHMRDPKQFRQNGSDYHLVAFQFIVGGKILSMFVNPIMWCITIAYFAFRSHVGVFIEGFFPPAILYIGVFSFVMGNFLYLYYYMIAAAHKGFYDLIKYIYVVPFYWLMMSVASWRAVYEMIVKPHYWAKTLHGLHLKSDKGLTQARSYIGTDVVDADTKPRVLIEEQP